MPSVICSRLALIWEEHNRPLAIPVIRRFEHHIARWVHWALGTKGLMAASHRCGSVILLTELLWCTSIDKMHILIKGKPQKSTMLPPADEKVNYWHTKHRLLNVSHVVEMLRQWLTMALR
jgi:hypothetical protein